ncbi:MAG: FkbM family methyltransferase [Bryobacterales bacterium]|nr:FkbM family methyltransferase [Bryobacterales bacterium]
MQPDVWLTLHTDSDLCRILYSVGYEFSERDFVNRVVRPGDTFIDVGANIGLYSVLAAHIVGPAGRVVSFEPSSRTFQRLQANITAGGYFNVICHQLALGANAGTDIMTVLDDGRDAWNTISSSPHDGEFHLESVRTVTWDDLTQKHEYLHSAILIKVDIEGAEHAFLRGAPVSLMRGDAPSLLIEVQDSRAGSGAELCNLLLQYGYRLYEYQRASASLVPHSLQQFYKYTNLIATKHLDHLLSRLEGGTSPSWLR